MADNSATSSSLNLSENYGSSPAIMLSTSKVRTIMKSSPDAICISQEALFAMTKATELFMQKLAIKTFENKTDLSRHVTYQDLADYVQNDENLEFLHEIIPPKVKMADVWHLVNQEN